MCCDEQEKLQVCQAGGVNAEAAADHIVSQGSASTIGRHPGQEENTKAWELFTRTVDKAAAGDGQSQHGNYIHFCTFLYVRKCGAKDNYVIL